MNGVFLYEAMGGIRPAYVDEAEKQTFAKPRWKKNLPLTACLTVILSLSAAVLHWAGLGFPEIPALAAPGQSVSTELQQAAEWLAVLSDPVRAVIAGGVLLFLGLAIGRLTQSGKPRCIKPGVGKFLLVLGLQILLILPCVLPWKLDGVKNPFLQVGFALIRACRFLLPTVGFLWVYIYDLQKYNGRKASWGYPLGVAVFPIVFVLMTGGQTEETVRSALFSSYYGFCLMVSVISTVLLKLQARRKGA